MSVGVLDYGLGNVGSVVNMLKRIDADPVVVDTPAGIAHADRLLLPGVGSFDRGMALLTERGFDDALRAFAQTGRPLLGICLGMQLLLDGSDEGQAGGLGIIPGRSRRFLSKNLRVPHMGWNRVTPEADHPLANGIPDENRFYFVHSFHTVPARDENVLASTTYGETFASMLHQQNVLGAQFHPEKSHRFGMDMLRSFAAI